MVDSQKARHSMRDNFSSNIECRVAMTYQWDWHDAPKAFVYRGAFSSPFIRWGHSSSKRQEARNIYLVSCLLPLASCMGVVSPFIRWGHSSATKHSLL